MADPASLNVDVRLRGLSLEEGVTVFANLPAGSVTTVRTTQPALGGKRYAIQAHGLSVTAASDLTMALLLLVEHVAGGGNDA